MKALADLCIAFLELLEAEGAALRRHSFRFALALGLLLVTLLMLLTGAAFLLVGVYWALTQLTNAVGAALILGLLLIIIAGGLLWTARNLVK